MLGWPRLTLSLGPSNSTDLIAACTNVFQSAGRSTGHGARDKAVWVLLPLAPDWRWMLDRPDSPWYPTMRLYRQTSLGDWSAVIQNVGQQLEQCVAQHASAKSSNQ